MLSRGGDRREGRGGRNAAKHSCGGTRCRRGGDARTAGGCGPRRRARRREAARQDPPHRRHLPGEPQLRQPLRPLGGRRGVRGADRARTRQVNQQGAPTRACSRTTSTSRRRRSSATCNDSTTATPFASDFPNEPFLIDDYIPATATTCPAPGVFAANGVPNGSGLPGGCTRDLVHRYYQEQYQLNDGRQNRYVTGSDAVGPDDGRLRHARAADLRVPAPARPSALRDRRQLLPGRVRRLVPEPPVAGRRGDADLAGRAQRRQRGRPALGRGRQRDADTTTRSTRRSRRSRTGAHRVVHPPRAAADTGRHHLRRLRRQHDAAGLPAVRAGNGRDRRLPPQTHATIGTGCARRT